MEEILSSIKRIIAEEGEEAAKAPRAPRRGRETAPVELADATALDAVAAPDEVLELTDEVEVEEGMTPSHGSPARASAPSAKASAPVIDPMLSVESEVAARHSLSALSSMVVKPEEGGDNTLEALVRSMLRPMLKEWLDASLPDMVEAMVAKEIARITGSR